MVIDLSRLPSPRCPAARALRLRDRIASRRGAAWAIANALVRRLARISVSPGEATEKLRPGATALTRSHSIALAAAPLPAPPWGDDASEPLALLVLPALPTEQTSEARTQRPAALVGARALPSVCLTPRLLPIPAGCAF